jgi:Dolichyl-phosphate-mannose-protein mannosyltransferase
MAFAHAFRMRLVSARIKAGATPGIGLLLVLFFIIQGIFFIRANSQTYDEAMHLAAGYSYLAKRDFRINPENPPLNKELLALPLFLGYKLPFNPDPQHWRDGADFLIGQDFLYRSTISADRMLGLSRLPNLFLGGSLIALIGWWSYRLWGGGAAILAMGLACFEPNLIAHSSLATADMGVTLFIFLSVYFLWEYLNSPTWWLLAATGLATGMALISKFLAILLIPMIALILATSLLITREDCALLPLRDRPKPSTKIFQAATAFFLIVLIALWMISIAYFFQGWQPWFFGLQRILTLAREGQLAFFFGEHSYQGWWSYFMVAFLIKTPVGSLVLITASVVFYRAAGSLGRREAMLLLVPVSIIFLAATQSKTNIGLRHILPVYPFLFVLASRLATVRFNRRWLAQFLVGAPLIFTAVSSLRIAPHQLAYFNEFVGGPDQGYRYLSDSNVDWGQDLKGVKAYMEKENLPIIYLSYHGTAPPSYYGIRYQYVRGTWPLEWPPPADRVPAEAPRKILAISVYNLQDVSTAYYPLFRWLWVRQPIAKIGYSIFVYDLTHDREGLAKLEETYGKAGVSLPP